MLQFHHLVVIAIYFFFWYGIIHFAFMIFEKAIWYCNKVGGFLKLSVIEDVAFQLESINAVVIWLLYYPHYNCFWWSSPQWYSVYDVLWCLWGCLDGCYYLSTWLVNGSFIVFYHLPASKKSIHLANSSSRRQVMVYK